MNPGTTVRVTTGIWAGRTGTVVGAEPQWPDYLRVQFDEPWSNPPQLIELEQLERHARAGQLGLFGGAA